MTRYTVTWVEEAQDELARIWMETSDPKEVTLAANAIDRELALDPSRKGLPISEGLRALSIPPLCVLFSVRELDRLVEVARVRRDPPWPGLPTNGPSALRP